MSNYLIKKITEIPPVQFEKTKDFYLLFYTKFTPFVSIQIPHII